MANKKYCNKYSILFFSMCSLVTLFQFCYNYNFLVKFNRPSELEHVVFLKVAKTGSSTVQGIFLRFAESRQLTVALPHSNKTLKESCCDNVISFNNSLLDTNILPPPPGRHFEVLCSHVIYNRARMTKYFPQDTAYVGIVREPIHRLESAIHFYGMYPGITLSEVSENPFLYNALTSMTSKNNSFRYPLANMSNNRMAYEFGFPLDLFPTSVKSYKIQNLMSEAVQTYIKQLDNDFKIILINEKMDESLVLMKRLLHWKISDILYMKGNVANGTYKVFNKKARDKIKPYLYLDFALYEFAVNRLKKQIKQQRSDFEEEVEYFKGLQEKISRYCKTLSRDDTELKIAKSKWSESIQIRKSDCDRYETDELTLTKSTRLRLYNTLIN